MTNKILITTFLLGILMLGVVGVFAIDSIQNTVVRVSSTSSMNVTPGQINFGSITPGTPAPIVEDATTFTAVAGSNEDFRISVLNVTGIFSNNIEVTIANTNGFDNLESLNVTMECQSTGTTPCTYTPIILDARLDVPLGTPAGQHNGVIIYLITAQTPIFP